jgi:hypothetical protein
MTLPVADASFPTAIDEHAQALTGDRRKKASTNDAKNLR